jgi:hypothetical protein
MLKQYRMSLRYPMSTVTCFGHFKIHFNCGRQYVFGRLSQCIQMRIHEYNVVDINKRKRCALKIHTGCATSPSVPVNEKFCTVVEVGTTYDQVLSHSLLNHLQVQTLLHLQDKVSWYPFIHCHFHSNQYHTSDRCAGNFAHPIYKVHWNLGSFTFTTILKKCRGSTVG